MRFKRIVSYSSYTRKYFLIATYFILFNSNIA